MLAVGVGIEGVPHAAYARRLERRRPLIVVAGAGAGGATVRALFPRNEGAIIREAGAVVTEAYASVGGAWLTSGEARLHEGEFLLVEGGSQIWPGRGQRLHAGAGLGALLRFWGPSLNRNAEPVLHLRLGWGF